MSTPVADGFPCTWGGVAGLAPPVSPHRDKTTEWTLLRLLKSLALQYCSLFDSRLTE